MDKFVVKSLVFSSIFFGTWVVVFLLIRARTVTNPTTTDDGQWMYATAGTTLTAAKWNNLVNRSVFRTYLNASQSLSANTRTKINIDTKEFDTNNEFDTSSGKFTPKRAGKYSLTASCYFGGLAAWEWWLVAIRKNWTSATVGSYSMNWGSSYMGSTVTSIVDANWTSDYFESYCRINKAISIYPWDGYTYFEGFRVE